MKKLLLFAAILLSFSTLVSAQSGVIRGEESAGNYSNLKSTTGVLQTIVNSGAVTVSGTVTATPPATDPCASSGITKSSVLVNITSATTTQLVALSGTTIVYVCNFTLTVSQVITTANTIKFVYGTGSACGTGTTDLTGTFGAGGITASLPMVIMGGGNTLFKTIAGNALCATTAIGASGTFQGIVTYVQQ